MVDLYQYLALNLTVYFYDINYLDSNKIKIEMKKEESIITNLVFSFVLGLIIWVFFAYGLGYLYGVFFK